jgi:AAA family ATP:ADP antiporter
MDNANPPTNATWLARLIPMRRGEYRVVLLSALYFFLLMMGFYLLRPLRNTFGIMAGADKLPLVWTGTLLLMAAINPIYAALTARHARRAFIPGVNLVFAAMLMCFGLLYQALPGHGGPILGFTFHLWFSVFNLFVVSFFL